MLFSTVDNGRSRRKLKEKTKRKTEKIVFHQPQPQQQHKITNLTREVTVPIKTIVNVQNKIIKTSEIDEERENESEIRRGADRRTGPESTEEEEEEVRAVGIK